MKKVLLLTAVLVSVASMASALTIKGTKHDLSSTGSAGTFITSNTQICIFCHTPHNAVPAVPLWNRSNPTLNGSITKFYNTSPTLSGAASNFKGGASPTDFQTTSVSLMCLSCHDGSTALGQYQNKANAGSDNGVALSGRANIAGDTDQLSNDHPIGFSYAAAVGSESRLFDLATANNNLGGNAFFGTGGVYIECSSCHKVHDNAIEPFLRKDNTGSALCLACHNK